MSAAEALCRKAETSAGAASNGIETVWVIGGFRKGNLSVDSLAALSVGLAGFGESRPVESYVVARAVV